MGRTSTRPPRTCAALLLVISPLLVLSAQQDAEQDALPLPHAHDAHFHAPHKTAGEPSVKREISEDLWQRSYSTQVRQFLAERRERCSEEQRQSSSTLGYVITILLLA